MSRLRSSLPIFAFSRHKETQRRVALYRDVHTIPFDSVLLDPETLNRNAIDELIKRDIVASGDLVIITKGDYLNAQGGTNTLKVLRI
ncbi:pyruvate kinase alpha/beta domain-containing protein [Neptunomonas antarctica]|uniref:Pyruvate kinase n=1 Tax=Neptunomonas antarctica TaxID=619304 RepID=A0A1N7KZI1_9GAMM|nr:pyruvate kinase alpha/beta domain-containing protein [Neptunomonas antarctica]SIS66985.1 pyruvate kinase [Neptunomonas antarctica]